MAYSINYNSEDFFRDSFRRYFPQVAQGITPLSPPPIDENEPDRVLAEGARQLGISTGEYQLLLRENAERQQAIKAEENRRMLQEYEDYQNRIKEQNGEKVLKLKDTTKNMIDSQRVEAFKNGELIDEKYAEDLREKSASELEYLYGEDTANLAREISLQKLQMYNTASGKMPEGVGGGIFNDVKGFASGVAQGTIGIFEGANNLITQMDSSLSAKEKEEILRRREEEAIERNRRLNRWAGTRYENAFDYDFWLRDIYNFKYNQEYLDALNRTGGDKEIAKEYASREANQLYADMDSITQEFLVQGFGSQVPQIAFAYITGGIGGSLFGGVSSAVSKQILTQGMKASRKHILEQAFKIANKTKDVRQAKERLKQIFTSFPRIGQTFEKINKARAVGNFVGSTLGASAGFGMQSGEGAYTQAMLRGFDEYNSMTDKQKEELFNTPEMLSLRERVNADPESFGLNEENLVLGEVSDDDLFAIAMDIAGNEAKDRAFAMTFGTSLVSMPFFQAVFMPKTLSGVVSSVPARIGLALGDAPIQAWQEKMQEMTEGKAPLEEVNRATGYDVFKDTQRYGLEHTSNKGALLAGAFSGTSAGLSLGYQGVRGVYRKTRDAIQDGKEALDNFGNDLYNSLPDSVKNQLSHYNNNIKQITQDLSKFAQDKTRDIKSSIPFRFIESLKNEMDNLNSELKAQGRKEIKSKEEAIYLFVNELQNQVDRKESFDALSPQEQQQRIQEIEDTENNIQKLNRSLTNIRDSVSVEYQNINNDLNFNQQDIDNLRQQRDFLTQQVANGTIPHQQAQYTLKQLDKRINKAEKRHQRLLNKFNILDNFINSNTFIKIEESINRGNNVNFTVLNNNNPNYINGNGSFNFDNFTFDNDEINYQDITEVSESINNAETEEDANNIVLGFIKSFSQKATTNVKEDYKKIFSDLKTLKQTLENKKYSNEFIDTLIDTFRVLNKQMNDPNQKKTWLDKNNNPKASLSTFMDKFFGGSTEGDTKFPSVMQLALNLLDPNNNTRSISDATRFKQSQKDKLDALVKAREDLNKGKYKSGDKIVLRQDENGNDIYLKDKNNNDVVFKGNTKKDIENQMFRYTESVKAEYDLFNKLLDNFINKKNNFIKNNIKKSVERENELNRQKKERALAKKIKDTVETLKDKAIKAGETFDDTRRDKAEKHLEKILKNKGEESLDNEIERLNKIYDKKVEEKNKKTEPEKNSEEKTETKNEKVKNEEENTNDTGSKTDVENIQDIIDKKDKVSWFNLLNKIPKEKHSKQSEKFLTDLGLPDSFDEITGTIHFNQDKKPNQKLLNKAQKLLSELFNTEIKIDISPRTEPENKQVEGIKPKVNDKGKVNIYAGNNSNKHLSNFAPYKVEHNGNTFANVESAFHYQKLEYADKNSETNKEIEKQLLDPNITGAKARTLGRKIEGLNTKEWDKHSFDIQKELIRKSLEQNPEKLNSLLLTEDLPLTHENATQQEADNGSFAKALTELREEFRNKDNKVNEEQSYSNSGSEIKTEENNNVSEVKKERVIPKIEPNKKPFDKDNPQDYSNYFYRNLDLNKMQDKEKYDELIKKYFKVDRDYHEGKISIDDLLKEFEKIKQELDKFYENLAELKNEQEKKYIKNISKDNSEYNIQINPKIKTEHKQWQQDNPDGIVAYRINFDKYNTAEEVKEGRIGNPFSENSRGLDTVEQFYEWLITGNNFGNAKATEEFRQAIIEKILDSDENTPILYYKELNDISHASVIGYLIRNKNLLNQEKNNIENTSSGSEIKDKQINLSNYIFDILHNDKIKDEKLNDDLYTEFHYLHNDYDAGKLTEKEFEKELEDLKQRVDEALAKQENKSSEPEIDEETKKLKEELKSKSISQLFINFHYEYEFGSDAKAKDAFKKLVYKAFENDLEKAEFLLKFIDYNHASNRAETKSKNNIRLLVLNKYVNLGKVGEKIYQELVDIFNKELDLTKPVNTKEFKSKDHTFTEEDVNTALKELKNYNELEKEISDTGSEENKNIEPEKGDMKQKRREYFIEKAKEGKFLKELKEILKNQDIYKNANENKKKELLKQLEEEYEEFFNDYIKFDDSQVEYVKQQIKNGVPMYEIVNTILTKGTKYKDFNFENHNIERLFYRNEIASQISQIIYKELNNNTPKKLYSIEFTENANGYYKERTKFNADNADITLAFAVDFTTSGEKLTKKLATNEGRTPERYFAIDISKALEITDEQFDKIIDALNNVDAKVINIAGNGFATISSKSKYGQQDLDYFMFKFFQRLKNSGKLKNEIVYIRSGGQTGFDEAGIVGAMFNGYKTKIHAPKKYLFEYEKRKGIFDEWEFKERFDLLNDENKKKVDKGWTDATIRKKEKEQAQQIKERDYSNNEDIGVETSEYSFGKNKFHFIADTNNEKLVKQQRTKIKNRLFKAIETTLRNFLQNAVSDRTVENYGLKFFKDNNLINEFNQLKDLEEKYKTLTNPKEIEKNLAEQEKLKETIWEKIKENTVFVDTLYTQGIDIINENFIERTVKNFNNKNIDGKKALDSLDKLNKVLENIDLDYARHGRTITLNAEQTENLKEFLRALKPNIEEKELNSLVEITPNSCLLFALNFKEYLNNISDYLYNQENTMLGDFEFKTKTSNNVKANKNVKEYLESFNIFGFLGFVDNNGNIIYDANAIVGMSMAMVEIAILNNNQGNGNHELLSEYYSNLQDVLDIQVNDITLDRVIVKEDRGGNYRSRHNADIKYDTTNISKENLSFLGQNYNKFVKQIGLIIAENLGIKFVKNNDTQRNTLISALGVEFTGYLLNKQLINIYEVNLIKNLNSKGEPDLDKAPKHYYINFTTNNTENNQHFKPEVIDAIKNYKESSFKLNNNIDSDNKHLVWFIKKPIDNIDSLNNSLVKASLDSAFLSDRGVIKELFGDDLAKTKGYAIVANDKVEFKDVGLHPVNKYLDNGDDILNTIPEALEKSIDNHNRTPYKFDTFYTDLLVGSNADIIDLVGNVISDEELETFLPEYRESVKSRNSIVKSAKDTLYRLIREANEVSNTKDAVIYYQHSSIKTQRIMQTAKDNPQNNKVVREFIITHNTLTKKELDQAKEKALANIDLANTDLTDRELEIILTTAFDDLVLTTSPKGKTRSVRDLIKRVNELKEKQKSGKISNEFLKELGQSTNLVLGLAQALGVKIEKNSFATICNKLQEFFDNNSSWVNPLVDDLHKLMENPNSTDIDKDNFKTLGKKFTADGKLASMRALSALKLFAEYKYAKKGDAIKSHLYLEADGVSNGMSNIIMQFSSKLNATYFRNLDRIGLTNPAKIFNIFKKIKEAKTKNPKLKLENVEDLGKVLNKEDIQELMDMAEGTGGLFEKDKIKDVYQVIANSMSKNILDNINSIRRLNAINEYLKSDFNVDFEGISLEDFLFNANIDKFIKDNLIYNNNIKNDKYLNEELKTFLKFRDSIKNTITFIMETYVINGTISGEVSNINSDKKEDFNITHLTKLMRSNISSLNEKDQNKFALELARSFTKIGMTPRVYGGKIDGINNQFKKDISSSIKKFLNDLYIRDRKTGVFKSKEEGMNYFKNDFNASDYNNKIYFINTWLKLNGLYKDNLKLEYLQLTFTPTSREPSEKSVIFVPNTIEENQLKLKEISKHIANNTYKVEEVAKNSVSKLLLDNVNENFSEIFENEEFAIKLDNLAVSIFRNELADRIQQKMEERNKKLEYAENDPRRNDLLSSKEILAIMKTIPSFPLTGTAFTKDTSKFLEDLVYDAHSFLKIEFADKENNAYITSTYQSVSGSKTKFETSTRKFIYALSANITEKLTNYLAGGATNYTSTVVSTEGIDQAFAFDVGNQLGIASSDVYDGNESNYSLAKLFGIMMNQAYIKEHLRVNLFERLFERFNRLNIQDYINISDDIFNKFSFNKNNEIIKLVNNDISMEKVKEHFKNTITYKDKNYTFDYLEKTSLTAKDEKSQKWARNLLNDKRNEYILTKLQEEFNKLNPEDLHKEFVYLNTVYQFVSYENDISSIFSNLRTLFEQKDIDFLNTGNITLSSENVETLKRLYSELISSIKESGSRENFNKNIQDNFYQYMKSFAEIVADKYASSKVEEKFISYGVNQFAGSNRGIITNTAELFKQDGVFERWLKHTDTWEKSLEKVDDKRTFSELDDYEKFVHFIENDKQIKDYRTEMKDKKLSSLLINSVGNRVKVEQNSTLDNIFNILKNIDLKWKAENAKNTKTEVVPLKIGAKTYNLRVVRFNGKPVITLEDFLPAYQDFLGSRKDAQNSEFDAVERVILKSVENIINNNKVINNNPIFITFEDSSQRGGKISRNEYTQLIEIKNTNNLEDLRNSILHELVHFTVNSFLDDIYVNNGKFKHKVNIKESNKEQIKKDLETVAIQFAKLYRTTSQFSKEYAKLQEIGSKLPENTTAKESYKEFKDKKVFSSFSNPKDNLAHLSAGILYFFTEPEIRNNSLYDIHRKNIINEFLAYGLSERNFLVRLADMKAPKKKGLLEKAKELFDRLKNTVAKIFFLNKDSGYNIANSKEAHSALFTILEDAYYISENTDFHFDIFTGKKPKNNEDNNQNILDSRIFENVEFVDENNLTIMPNGNTAHQNFRQDLHNEIRNVIDYPSILNQNVLAEQIYTAKINDIQTNNVILTLRNNGIFPTQEEEHLFYTMAGIYELAFMNEENKIKVFATDLLKNINTYFDTIPAFHNMDIDNLFKVGSEVDLANAFALITSIEEIYEPVKEFFGLNDVNLITKLNDLGLFTELKERFDNLQIEDNIITKVAYSAVKLDIAKAINTQTRQRIIAEEQQQQIRRLDFRTNLRDTLNRHNVPNNFVDLVMNGVEDWQSGDYYGIRNQEETKIGEFIQNYISNLAEKHGKMTFVANVLRWFLQSRNNTRPIYDARGKTLFKVEQLKENVRAFIPSTITSKFNEDFTEELNKLIHKTVNQTKLSDIYFNNESDLNKLIHLLRDDNVRNARITELLNDVDTNLEDILNNGLLNIPRNKMIFKKEDLKNWIHYQAMGLAQLNIYGSSHSIQEHSSFILPNAKAIASLNPLFSLVGIDQQTLNQSIEGRVDRLEPIISELSSIYSLKLSEPNDLMEVSNKILNNKEAFNLIFYTFKSQKDLYKKENRNNLVGYDSYNYTQNTYSNRDVKIALDEEEIKYFEDLGYVKYMQLNNTGILDNTQTIMVSSCHIKERFQTGLFSLNENSLQGASLENYEILSPHKEVFDKQSDIDHMNQNALKAFKAMMIKRNVNNYWNLSNQAINGNETFNSIMHPVIDEDGHIIGYSYILPKKIENAINPQRNLGIEALSYEYAKRIEENIGNDINIQHINMLNNLKNTDTTHPNQYFQIKISYNGFGGENIFIDLPNTGSNLKYKQKIYKIIKTLPYKTKEHIATHGLWINRTEVDNILGYERLNIIKILTDLKYVPASHRNNIFALVGAFVGDIAGKPISRHILQKGEKFLSEVVNQAKKVILEKSFIPVGNLVSNALHLTSLGINPKDMFLYAKEGLYFTEQYNKIYKDYIQFSLLLQNEYLKQNNPQEYAKIEKQQQINKKLLEENPINYLTYKGIYSSIYNERNYEISAYDSNLEKDKILNQINQSLNRHLHLDKVYDFLLNKNTKHGRILNEVFMTEESKLYNFSQKVLNYGDFIAKYVLIKHLMNKHNIKLDNAIDVAREEFVNYGMNRGATFDYLNKMGMTWFLAYATGINKVIMNRLRSNFLRTSALYTVGKVVQDPLGLIQTPAQNNLVEKNWDFVFSPSNTLNSFEEFYLIKLYQLLFK